MINMKLTQLLIIGIIIINVILEIKCFILKKQLHKINVNSDVKTYIKELLSTDNDVNVISGNLNSFDIYKNQITVTSEINKQDEFCIFVHEYGHYKDIRKFSKDIKDAMILIKFLVFILGILILVLLFGKYLLNFNNEILVFFLLLELILMIVDLVISIRLEIGANKNAYKILRTQIVNDYKECEMFCRYTMLSQFIYRFYFVLFPISIMLMIKH